MVVLESSRPRPRVVSTWSALLLLLAACAIPITYRDQVTYDRLCDLKVECLDVVERLAGIGAVDASLATTIHEARLGVRKLVVRETGKGDDNADTTKQVQLIQSLFEDDLDEFRKGDVARRLGPKYAEEARKELADAFDVAIATEALKNKKGG
jgi:hypothetical protein